MTTVTIEKTRRPAAEIAETLRLHAGQWIVIDSDQHNRIHARISRYRRGAVKVYPPERFSFRVQSNGYRSGTTRLLARFEPVTFEI